MVIWTDFDTQINSFVPKFWGMRVCDFMITFYIFYSHQILYVMISAKTALKAVSVVDKTC